MKRIGLSMLAVLGVAGTASAAPISLPGNTGVIGTFEDLEQVNINNTLTVPGYAPALGMTMGNWGVLDISTLQWPALPSTPHLDLGGAPVKFSDGGPGTPQITGIVYGVNFQDATGTRATGGFIDLYWQDSGTIDSTCLAGTTCTPDAATVARFTTGTFLARLAFNNGIDPTGPTPFTTFITSNTSPTTNGATGHSDGFLDVVTGAMVGGKLGAWAGILDGNWFLPPLGTLSAFGARDIRFTDEFVANLASWNAPGGTVGILSHDPVRAFTAATVPEPATMTLLGIGLLGAAARRRKKN